MNYIILDLEWNADGEKKKKKEKKLEEIIEIGAVKIKGRDTANRYAFSMFVKPKRELTRFIQHMTGITPNHVENALHFKQVMQKFKQFIGEEYTFIVWGKEDIKLLKQDCERFGICDINLDSYIDLQQVLHFTFQEEFDHNSPGLKRAVETLGLPWNGKNHRAIDDARNTTKLFTVIHEKVNIHEEYHKAQTGESFFLNGELNHKGRAHVKRWVNTCALKEKNIHITWEEFSTSSVWKNSISQFELNEKMITKIKHFYPEAQSIVAQNLEKKIS